MTAAGRVIRLADLVTLSRAGRELDLEQSTLYQLRGRADDFPTPAWQEGRLALYDLGEIREWYAARKGEGSDDA